MNDEDRILIKRLYGLSDKQVFETEKLYSRSSFSICAAAKVIRDKPKGDELEFLQRLHDKKISWNHDNLMLAQKLTVSGEVHYEIDDGYGDYRLTETGLKLVKR
jgi:hypothetical protein